MVRKLRNSSIYIYSIFKSLWAPMDEKVVPKIAAQYELWGGGRKRYIVICGSFLGNEWANTLPRRDWILGTKWLLNTVSTDKKNQSCEHLENRAVAWERIHGYRGNAFSKTVMEPLEAVISILFSGIYKRQCIRQYMRRTEDWVFNSWSATK
jgi:hypothetical protein